MAKSMDRPSVSEDNTAIGISYALPVKPTMPYTIEIVTVNGTMEIKPRITERSRKIILAQKAEQEQQDCHPVKAPEKCKAMDAEDILTLQMLWLLGAPGKQ